jgi:hypothetical protein
VLRQARLRHEFLAVSIAMPNNATMQAEPPKAEPTNRKRRLFQFRLWTLLTVVMSGAALLVAAGTWSVIMNKTHGPVPKTYRLDEIQQLGPASSERPEPVAPIAKCDG